MENPLKRILPIEIERSAAAGIESCTGSGVDVNVTSVRFKNDGSHPDQLGAIRMRVFASEKSNIGHPLSTVAHEELERQIENALSSGLLDK